MKIDSEAAMLEFGRNFARQLDLPAVIELVGDVGTGKTTFTRGLATGLGVAEPVTSPSFTISKRYAFPIASQSRKDSQLAASQGVLIHYDFYRLGDPGIMRDELSEALAEPNAVIVVEWGGDVAELLPEHKYHLEISLNEDGTRQVTVTPELASVLDSSADDVLVGGGPTPSQSAEEVSV